MRYIFSMVSANVATLSATPKWNAKWQQREILTLNDITLLKEESEDPAGKKQYYRIGKIIMTQQVHTFYQFTYELFFLIVRNNWSKLPLQGHADRM